jgi:23S rRNA (adenine2503-C2)-methyltransferase
LTDPTVIRATEDASVNFVTHTGDGGAFEARYVRRTEDYLIAYVSSQTGCDRSCRFCHLTATGQTTMGQAGVDDFAGQVRSVLQHHCTQEIRPGRMNVNFMARGEPLLNPVLNDREAWLDLRGDIRMSAARVGIDEVRYNVSTIMPAGARIDGLADVFADDDVTMYYSLYSMRDAFRRRWLPKTLPPAEALAALARWQDSTGQLVALHWAFIEGENDDKETIVEIIRAVEASGLRSKKFNAVRYNPFSPRQGREPDEHVVERNFRMLADAFGHPSSRIVPRVGFSAKASCGMFVDKPR